MDAIVEIVLRIVWVIIKSPYRPIRYIFDKEYKKMVRAENENAKIEIFAFLFKDLIILLGMILGLIIIGIFIAHRF